MVKRKTSLSQFQPRVAQWCSLIAELGLRMPGHAPQSSADRPGRAGAEHGSLPAGEKLRTGQRVWENLFNGFPTPIDPRRKRSASLGAIPCDPCACLPGALDADRQLLAEASQADDLSQELVGRGKWMFPDSTEYLAIDWEGLPRLPCAFKEARYLESKQPSLLEKSPFRDWVPCQIAVEYPCSKILDVTFGGSWFPSCVRTSAS